VRKEEEEERFYSPFGGNGAYWTKERENMVAQTCGGAPDCSMSPHFTLLLSPISSPPVVQGQQRAVALVAVHHHAHVGVRAGTPQVAGVDSDGVPVQELIKEKEEGGEKRRWK
jgi:hypothetical protein